MESLALKMEKPRRSKMAVTPLAKVISDSLKEVWMLRYLCIDQWHILLETLKAVLLIHMFCHGFSEARRSPGSVF